MEKPGVRRRLTKAGIRQRRMAAVKQGRRAEVVTEEDSIRYRLEKIDPEAPELIERFARAIGGDITAIDPLIAGGFASKELIRRKLVEEIRARGVIIEEVIMDEGGNEIGRRAKANPALDPSKHMDEHLGLTADQAQLSRKSRDAGAVDAAWRRGSGTMTDCGLTARSRSPPAIRAWDSRSRIFRRAAKKG